MNETQTWFQLIPGYGDLWAKADPVLSRHWQWMLFGNTYFTLTHIAGALLIALFLVYASSRFRKAVQQGGEEALLPPERFDTRTLVELVGDATLGVMEGVMGPKQARRFFPFIGSLALFILFSNLLGLVPGFVPPTVRLQTNFALALTVFLATHLFGVKDHGLAYFKHFLGPILWLAPLMIVVEVISHLARPVSLTLRLVGNMFADHKVVGVLTLLVPILVPVPFLLLGILVSIIQTLVFCLLAMVYISMALEHAEESPEGHAQHAH